MKAWKRRKLDRECERANRELRRHFQADLRARPAVARLWRHVYGMRRYCRRHKQARRILAGVGVVGSILLDCKFVRWWDPR